MRTGYIFDIQNCSLHDGPGLRTTVFFKGCPLRCLWCANPESQRPEPQIMYFADKCVDCGACSAICPNGAAKSITDCKGCGKCVDACIHDARRLVGRLVTSDEVYAEIQKDRTLYERTGGGVTLSGGEVLMQPDFAEEILKKCKDGGINTLLDSSCFCYPEIFKRVTAYADMVYIDIKCIDPLKHKEHTGVDNQLIIENLRYMDQNGIPFSIRMPIIPGYNDTDEIINDTISMLKTLQSNFSVYLLPYHSFGKAKYGRIGRVWPMDNLGNLARSELIPLQTRMKDAGLSVYIQ